MEDGQRVTLLQAVFDGLPIPLAVLRAPHFLHELVNPLFRALAPDRALLGKPYAEVWPEAAGVVLPILREALQTGEARYAIKVPLEEPRSEGEPPQQGSYAISCIPLEGSSPRSAVLLAMAPEIAGPTQLRLLAQIRLANGHLVQTLLQEQESAREAEQRAADLSATVSDQQRLQLQRDDLVRAISHDLRSPLAAVYGQAQMLQQMLKGAGAAPKMQRTIDAILVGARRMDAMIQDLVDSTRLELGQLHLDLLPTELPEFVEDLLDRADGVLETQRVRLDMKSGLPLLNVDPNRLERILINLLSNALKYSDDEVTVGAELTEGQVRLFVSDRGAGISPTDLPHIFDRFYRSSYLRRSGGLGLGLHITRMLVEAHGGKICVESQPGKGSTFSVLLPVVAPGATSPTLW